MTIEKIIDRRGFLGTATLALLAAVACGKKGNGSSPQTNTTIQPGATGNTPQGYTPRIDFDSNMNNYNLITTNVEPNIQKILEYLGGQSLEEAQSVGLSKTDFGNDYGKKVAFCNDFRAVYKPLIAEVARLEGLDLTDAQLNAEIDNLVGSMIDVNPPGLDDVNYDEGEMRVLFGKVNVDSKDEYFIAYRMISEENNPMVYVLVGGLSTPTGVIVDNNAMKNLYDFVKTDAGEGF